MRSRSTSSSTSASDPDGTIAGLGLAPWMPRLERDATWSPRWRPARQPRGRAEPPRRQGPVGPGTATRPRSKATSSLATRPSSTFGRWDLAGGQGATPGGARAAPTTSAVRRRRDAARAATTCPVPASRGPCVSPPSWSFSPLSDRLTHHASQECVSTAPPRTRAGRARRAPLRGSRARPIVRSDPGDDPADHDDHPDDPEDGPQRSVHVTDLPDADASTAIGGDARASVRCAVITSKRRDRSSFSVSAIAAALERVGSGDPMNGEVRTVLARRRYSAGCRSGRAGRHRHRRTVATSRSILTLGHMHITGFGLRCSSHHSIMHDVKTCSGPRHGTATAGPPGGEHACLTRSTPIRQPAWCAPSALLSCRPSVVPWQHRPNMGTVDRAGPRRGRSVIASGPRPSISEEPARREV